MPNNSIYQTAGAGHSQPNIQTDNIMSEENTGKAKHGYQKPHPWQIPEPLESCGPLARGAAGKAVVVLAGLSEKARVPSPFFPGILPPRKPPKTRWKRTMVEMNGWNQPLDVC